MSKPKQKKIFEPRLCVECLERWFVPIRENNVTCSPACKRRRDQKRRNAHRNPKPLTKVCKECGNSFVPARTDQPCCSEQCQDIRNKRFRAESQRRRNPGRSNAPSKKEEHRAIDDLRAYFGLKPLRRGMTTCMRCGRQFESEDIEHERMCPACNRLAEVYYSPPMRHHAGVGGSY